MPWLTILDVFSYIVRFFFSNRNLLSHSARAFPFWGIIPTKNYISQVFVEGYSGMTEKRPGQTEGVRLIELSAKREWTEFVRQYM